MTRHVAITGQDLCPTRHVDMSPSLVRIYAISIQQSLGDLRRSIFRGMDATVCVSRLIITELCLATMPVKICRPTLVHIELCGSVRRVTPCASLKVE